MKGRFRAYTQQSRYRHTLRLIAGVWLISGVTYRKLSFVGLQISYSLIERTGESGSGR